MLNLSPCEDALGNFAHLRVLNDKVHAVLPTNSALRVFGGKINVRVETDTARDEERICAEGSD